MNTQNNTPASRNEEAMALNITREGGAPIRVTSIRAMPHGFMVIGEHGMPYKFKGERADIRLAFDKTPAAAPSAAPGAAIDARPLLGSMNAASLAKGIELCRKHGHQGDAETLEELRTAIDAREQEAHPEHARALAEHILSMDLATEKGQHARALARKVLEDKDESPAEMALRSLASWLGCGGYNATAIDAAVMEQRIRNALASREEAPAASAQDAERFCNKCGYSGPDEQHERPNGSGRCGYLSCVSAPSEALSPPATVAQPVAGRMWIELSEKEQAACLSGFKGAHGSAPDFGFAPDRAWLEGYAAAQPCASQGCGGAPEYWIPADSNGVFTGRWMRSLALTDKEKASGDWIPLIRAALSTAKSGGGATPEGGEA